MLEGLKATQDQPGAASGGLLLKRICVRAKRRSALGAVETQQLCVALETGEHHSCARETRSCARQPFARAIGSSLRRVNLRVGEDEQLRGSIARFLDNRTDGLRAARGSRVSSGNSARRGAGGVTNDGTMQIRSSTITANQSFDDFAAGGIQSGADSANLLSSTVLVSFISRRIVRACS